MIKQSMTPKSQ